ncbi:MAG: hypothetical protein OEW21_09150 [Betaproteobacteria bacterium]|nr:hypothetical protein [Betaproteobacteria bacterium]
MNVSADLAPSRATSGARGLARFPIARLREVLGRAWPKIAAIFQRAGAFVLAIALTVTVTDLVLRLAARRTPPEPVQTVMTADLNTLTQPADVSSIARLLGALPDSGSGEIKLVGIIAQDTHGGGIALLSLDGKPARAARAGRQLAPNLSLVEVHKDRVLVNRAGALHEIRMPPKTVADAAPASSPLPQAPSASAGQAVKAPPPAQPGVSGPLRGRGGAARRPGSDE